MTFAGVLALIGELPSIIALIEQLITTVKVAGGTPAAVSAVSAHLDAFSPDSTLKVPSITPNA